ncbi:unnamed protein product [Soboliphyme baturini]|uniref:Transmembrane protein n=1 Tax=Soboliphyme baturini TaxID=241478 RepID=A0A183J473_9BILA|nr:unnamed protein product [Soboliphyme baturini]
MAKVALKLQVIFEILASTFCVVVTGVQLGVLDYYFVFYLKNDLWLLWIILDAVVVSVLCEDESNIRYAFVAWLVYSVILSAKICVIILLVEPVISKHELLGPNSLKFVLSLSALIYLLLVLSHHFNRIDGPRQIYLSYLASSITLDIMDSVLFLQLLIDKHRNLAINRNFSLQMFILALACFNFILPMFSLFKLRYRIGLPRWVPLPYEKVYSLFYFLTVNLPYLIIRARVYSSAEVSNDAYFFIIKNVVMVIVGIRELWVSFILRKSTVHSVDE